MTARLGYALVSRDCRPVPRGAWPPLLFHGAERPQRALVPRAPFGDYRAVYASFDVDVAMRYMREVDDDGYLTGALHVLRPLSWPDTARMLPGTEAGEIVVVPCAGGSVPATAVLRAADLARLVGGDPSDPDDGQFDQLASVATRAVVRETLRAGGPLQPPEARALRRVVRWSRGYRGDYLDLMTYTSFWYEGPGAREIGNCGGERSRADYSHKSRRARANALEREVCGAQK